MPNAEGTGFVSLRNDEQNSRVLRLAKVEFILHVFETTVMEIPNYSSGRCVFAPPALFLIQHKHSHIKSQARCGGYFRQVYAPADDLTAADASASRRRSTIKGSSRVLPGDQREGEVAERQARAYPVSILAVYLSKRFAPPPSGPQIMGARWQDAVVFGILGCTEEGRTYGGVFVDRLLVSGRRALGRLHWSRSDANSRWVRKSASRSQAAPMHQR